MPVHLPALYASVEMISWFLAKHFIDNFCKENKISKKTLSPEAQQKLLQYSFPGNVRELKSIMEFAVVMADDELFNPNI